MKKSYQILAVLLLAVFCFALFPESVSAEDSEKVLRVYNWGEYISNGDDGSLNTIKEFEARNPGVKVEYTTFATNEEMYAKIASGSANYDILIPSDYMIGRSWILTISPIILKLMRASGDWNLIQTMNIPYPIPGER